MLINGMHGMGDNIYQRALVREIKYPVHLITSWPQIYKDLPNVKPVKPVVKLRTQRKNVYKQPENIWHKSNDISSKKIRYGVTALNNGSIIKSMQKCLGTGAKVFDLPKFDKPEIKERYAVIRPVTIRKEWKNEARNPNPEYVSYAAEKLKRIGYKTVSVADLENGEEWAEALPICDISYNKGELTFEELMGLIDNASVIVGGVGWIVPAAIAYNTPLIIILGGQGGHNAPEKIVDNPMNAKNVRWIYPDNYCMCISKEHKCDKKISNFDEKINSAIESLCLTS